MSNNITLDQVRESKKFNFRHIYEANDDIDEYNDSPLGQCSTHCDYYEPNQFSKLITDEIEKSLSFFHLNCRSL